MPEREPETFEPVAPLDDSFESHIEPHPAEPERIDLAAEEPGRELDAGVVPKAPSAQPGMPPGAPMSDERKRFLLQHLSTATHVKVGDTPDIGHLLDEGLIEATAAGTIVLTTAGKKALETI